MAGNPHCWTYGRPYLNYRDASGYGLEFPFMVKEWPNRFVVFNRDDGAIYGVFLNDDQKPWHPSGRRAMSLAKSHSLCLELNGLYKAPVPTAEIDATP